MYLKQVDAREREIKEQTKVVNDGAIKIASFAPEFPALQVCCPEGCKRGEC